MQVQVWIGSLKSESRGDCLPKHCLINTDFSLWDLRRLQGPGPNARSCPSCSVFPSLLEGLGPGRQTGALTLFTSVVRAMTFILFSSLPPVVGRRGCFNLFVQFAQKKCILAFSVYAGWNYLGPAVLFCVKLKLNTFTTAAQAWKHLDEAAWPKEGDKNQHKRSNYWSWRSLEPATGIIKHC